MKIRSITLFADLSPRLDGRQLERLSAFAGEARDAYERAGITVQTVRLATRMLASLPAVDQTERKANQIASLESTFVAQGFEYISLGPAPRAMMPSLPTLLRSTKATFATAHILDPTIGHIDGEMIGKAAQVIRACAEIEGGFGNLRFSALANVAPGSPFFPAAYHDGGPPAFAIATEAADLAVAACQDASDADDAHRRLVARITDEGRRLVDVAEKLSEVLTSSWQAPRFLGIDFSLAPFPSQEISIGAALEMLSGQPLGSPGTLAAAAVLADAIDRARFPHTGFCGLMLPVLEDAVLAARSAEGRLRLSDLLQWSAVCGTGLDTVPIPGDAGTLALSQVLYDVAALSARLRKPLTARLMPLPEKRAGEGVHFDFAYFADGGVLPLDEGSSGGLFGEAAFLHLGPRMG